MLIVIAGIPNAQFEEIDTKDTKDQGDKHVHFKAQQRPSSP